ncbi:scaffolding protein [Sporolactobacillus sp. THM7-4]|nr:scaffolding protein [Sporolactobacillus sp. THM7-4]
MKRPRCYNIVSSKILAKLRREIFKMHIRPDATPNPNAMKFTMDTPMFDRRIEVKKGETIESPLLGQLLAIEDIDNLFAYHDFITINKIPSAQWEHLIPEIKNVFARF